VKQNSATATTINEKKKVDVLWKDVIVGDLLFVTKDQDFSADMIIFATGNKDGTVFISTSSLDGEKTLKTKNCIAET
jgi:P-type E1-E2 ATPase